MIGVFLERFALFGERKQKRGACGVIPQQSADAIVEGLHGILADLESKLWPLFENRQLLPLIHCVLPMTEAAEAHRILEQQENIGKVILEVIRQ